MKPTENKYPKKKLIQDLMLIFIIGLTPLLWFKQGCIIAGTDVTFPLNPIMFFFNRFFTWNYVNNTGVESAINITSIFFHGIQAFFYWITNSLFLTQKLSYYFWFTLICLSVYYFSAVIQRNKPNRLSRLIMVLVYAFNPFVFNIWEAAKASEISALVAMPLLLAFFIQGLDGRLSFFKASLFAGLSSLLFSEIGASPSVFVMPIGICIGYFIFYVLGEMFRKVKFKHICSLFGFFGLFFGIYILFNAYWILPYGFEIFKTLKVSAASSTLEVFNMANWLKGISTYTSILNVSRFQGAWDWYYSWRDEPYVAYAKSYFNNPFLLIISIALPILAYTAILFKRSKEVLFFTLVALIGTLFATGTHPPFGAIFLWLTKKISLFLVFRSPYYKFSLATLFAYAYLMSIAISSIYIKCRASEHFKVIIQIGTLKKYKLFPILIIIILIISYLFYNYPMITGEIVPIREKNVSLHLKVPNYVFRTADWLEGQKEDFKLICLPRENLDIYQWGYGSPTNLLNLISSKPVIWGGVAYAGKSPLRDMCYENIYEYRAINTYKFLQLMNVKYVWLRLDSWYDFYGNKTSPQFLKKIVAKLKGITFKKKIGKWEFYEVESPANLINIVKKGYLIYGDITVLPALANGYNLKETALIFNDENEKEKIVFLLEKGAVEKIIFFNYQAHALKKEIEKSLKKKNFGLDFIYTTNELPLERKGDYLLPGGIEIEKMLGFTKPERIAGGRERLLPGGKDWFWLHTKDWFWLHTNKEPNIILTNSSSIEQVVSFAFDVFSPHIDRNLYIYLNDNLLKYPSVKADKPATIRINALHLLPGKNVISFYTPHEKVKRINRIISFAFKDFQIGGLIFKGKLFVPKGDYYEIDIFPCSPDVIERNNIDFQKAKEFILGDSLVNLNYTEKYHFRKKKVFLHKGFHTFKINQFSTEDWYVKISKELPYNYKQHKIHFVKYNSTKYGVKTDSNEPYFLIFNETYNPCWELYMNNEPAKAKNHFKVNSYANAWYVDASGNQSIIIEYLPQRLFYAGILISTVSICLTVGSIIWSRRWKR